MSISRSVFNGVKWTGLSSVFKSIFQLLQYAILARFLSAEAFGLIAMAMFVISFSNIFIDMGLTSAILHKKQITKREFSSIYWLNIFIAIILFTIVFSATPLISDFYKEPELNEIIPILSFNLIIIAFGIQHRTMMQKELRFKAITSIEIFSIFIGLISAVILVLNDYGVYSLVYSTLISSGLQYILFFFLNLKRNPIIFFFKLSLIKDMLKIGSYQFGSTFLLFFSKEVDILIIGKLLGTESLGIYSLSKQLVVKISGVINPTITKVLSPVFSSLQDDNNRLKRGYLRMIYYLASVNVPIYLIFIVLSKEILGIIYGAEYSSGYLVLSFLALAYCTKSISNPIGSLLIAKGRTDLGLKWSAIQIIITVFAIALASLISIEFVAGTIAFLAYALLIPQWKLAMKPCIDISLKEFFYQFSKMHALVLFIGLFFLALFYFLNLDLNLYLSTTIKGVLLIITFIIAVKLFDKKRFLIFRELNIKLK